MILDIALVKSPSMFCEESAAATVAKCLNRDYEMMFSNMLGFSFNYSNVNYDLPLGKQFSGGYNFSVMEWGLENYHGIKTELYEVKEDIMKILVNEVNRGMPILVFPLVGYCPWMTEIKEGKKAFFLVIGYDEKFVYGYDIHSNSTEKKIMPINNLKKSYERGLSKKVRTYRIIASEKTEINFNDIKNSVYLKKYINSRPFLKMKALANVIDNGINISLERENCDNVNDIPFLIEIKHIMRARKLFAEMCYYLAKKKQDTFANYVGMCYLEVSNMWNIIWNKLLKLFFSEKNIYSSSKSIAEKIRTVAEKEEKIINNILQNVLEEKNFICVSNSITNDKGYSYINVDITCFYHNKAFTNCKDTDLVVDLTGNNEYFCCDEVTDKLRIQVGETTFIINNEYDNFVCSNQHVDVKSNRYKKIYILGCAEWGNASGYVIAGYENSRDMLLLEFPDWYYSRIDSTYVAWKGEAMDSEGNITERALFCLDYELKQDTLCWIEFPKVENMHIFGIKLLA